MVAISMIVIFPFTTLHKHFFRPVHAVGAIVILL